MKLAPEEALVAATANAAHVLGRGDRHRPPAARLRGRHRAPRRPGLAPRRLPPRRRRRPHRRRRRSGGVQADGIILAMATQKQRRRRAKEKRHDYDLVYVDEDGVEQVVERDEPREAAGAGGKGRRHAASAKAVRARARAARRGREAQPPSWRKVLKRGAIFAPIFLATVMLLGGGKITIVGGDRPDGAPARGVRPVQLLHGPRRLAAAAEAPQPRLVGDARWASPSTGSSSGRSGPTPTSSGRPRARPRRSSSIRAATRRRSSARSPTLGGALHGDPRHARPLRPHRQPRRPRGRDRRSGLRPAAERILFEDPSMLHDAGHHGQARRSRTTGSRAARRSTAAGHRLRGHERARATRRATSPTSPTAISSPATSSSPAPSAAPTCPAATGACCRRRSRLSSTRIRPRRSSTRATARRRRSAPSSQRNPFLADLRASRLPG